MTGLLCAVCLHVHFAAAEFDKPVIGEVSDAVTMYDGTALCRLHMEDYDRATGDGLLAIACRIIGVRRPHRTWGSPARPSEAQRGRR